MREVVECIREGLHYQDKTNIYFFVLIIGDPQIGREGTGKRRSVTIGAELITGGHF